MNTIPIAAAPTAATPRGLPARYLDPHQARTRAPTSYEDLLGDAIERAFAAGHWELDALVAYLNKSGPLGPNGQVWTADSFQASIKTLGV
jgi:hypothetical protein